MGGVNEIHNSIFYNNDGSQVGAVTRAYVEALRRILITVFLQTMMDGPKRWAGAGALNLRQTSSVNNCTFITTILPTSCKR